MILVKLRSRVKSCLDSGVVWDEAALDQWLTNPKKLVPGTKMVFAGLKKKGDRKNLIAFLTANCSK